MPQLINKKKIPVKSGKKKMNGQPIFMSNGAISWAATAFVLACSLHSTDAKAQQGCSDGGPATIYFQMPSSITVQPSTADKTVLTPWVKAAGRSFSCTASSRYRAHYMGFTSPGNLEELAAGKYQDIPSPGISSATAVYKSNLSGIGVAVTWRTYDSRCGWYPWYSGYGGNLKGHNIFDMPANNIYNQGNICPPLLSGSAVFKDEAMVALVKIGTIISGRVTGTTGSGIVAMSGLGVDDTKSGHAWFNLVGRNTYYLTPTMVKGATCTTPNVTVNLGKHPQSSFNGIGSTTPSVPFNIDLKDCPAGIQNIAYTLDATSPVISSSQGIISLSANATAKGIGVQVKRSDNSALDISYAHTLTGIKPSGGNYTIPLKASYYQSGASVTPGSANASMTFTINYF
ncbi:fimbrial protein [Comamonas composti]|uniref:fimbrial protein n=1 Tax=Comamonas composti TaxID=408558 RepID=UPI0003FD4D52|nr:fimbrial protein [Comamonas composti]